MQAPGSRQEAAVHLWHDEHLTKPCEETTSDAVWVEMSLAGACASLKTPPRRDHRAEEAGGLRTRG